MQAEAQDREEGGEEEFTKRTAGVAEAVPDEALVEEREESTKRISKNSRKRGKKKNYRTKPSPFGPQSSRSAPAVPTVQPEPLPVPNTVTPQHPNTVSPKPFSQADYPPQCTYLEDVLEVFKKNNQPVSLATLLTQDYRSKKRTFDYYLPPDEDDE